MSYCMAVSVADAPWAGTHAILLLTHPGLCAAGAFPLCHQGFAVRHALRSHRQVQVASGLSASRQSRRPMSVFQAAPRLVTHSQTCSARGLLTSPTPLMRSCSGVWTGFFPLSQTHRDLTLAFSICWVSLPGAWTRLTCTQRPAPSRVQPSPPSEACL